MELGQAILDHDHAKANQVLALGAVPDAADIDNSLLLAMSQNDQKMIRLLLKYGASPSKALAQAHEVEQAKPLMAMGANPNARISYFHMTPFMDQCTVANVDLVRFLLANGGDPTLRSEDGKGLIQMVEYAAGNHPERSTEYAKVLTMIRDAIKAKSGNTNL
jgi:ankyrin repeat protein